MRALPLLLVVLALTACTGGGRSSAGPTAVPTPGCPLEGDIPASCVPDDTGFDSPPPIDFRGAPRSSAAIPVVAFARQPGDLALGGNDTDPTLTRRTFRVTVPAGRRLSVTAACRGYADLVVTTTPASKAEVTLRCGVQEAKEVTVLEPSAAARPTSYQVNVQVPGPSRWFVAVAAVLAGG